MSDKVKTYVADISEFQPDPKNANNYTLRGRSTVDKSMRQRGYARPAFASKDNVVLGGNLSTLDVATDIGLGDGKVIVIETDGKMPIIHKRMDITSNSEEARLLAIEDNRTGELSLDWDTEQILADMRDGLDLGSLWNETELGEMIEDALLAEAIANSLTEPVSQSEDRKLGDKRKQIKPVLYVDELATFEKAITATGNPNRGHAIIEICQDYLDAKGQLDL